MSTLETIDTPSGSLSAYVARPEGEVRGGLIVIHEIWGLVSHTRDVADRFAREGYVVVAPDLLADQGITEEITEGLGEAVANPDPEAQNAVQPKLRELMAPLRTPGFATLTVERLKACFDHLHDDAEVSGRVGVVGFCFGGSYSFALAAHEPRLLASVPFYGAANFTEAELGRIKAPILAFYGQEDEALMTALPEVEEAMTKAGVDFSATVYANAGHAFFNDSNPFAYQQKAAEDAWTRTLEFLARHIA